ncbi:hypothetical protein GJAV_G00162370 [Gymnothorax javanicus]|nr:hypothetical protein GJAV_G00162370 [Gymnothorax javanicus]
MSHIIVLLSCLILSFLTSCDNTEAIKMIQTPPSIKVKEGETVQMQCCWGRNLNATHMRLKWMHNGASNNEIINVVFNTEKERHEKDKYSSYISGNCSCFNIAHVTPNDTGVFKCILRVEIPYFGSGEGGGTHLTVERKNNSVTAENSEHHHLNALLIPLLVVTGVLCLCALLFYWRRKKIMPYPGEASGRVGMVIHETPHTEEEETMEQEGEMALADNKGSKRSSDGSTQWCAVPVYESFDYFAVHTCEDG